MLQCRQKLHCSYHYGALGHSYLSRNGVVTVESILHIGRYLSGSYNVLRPGKCNFAPLHTHALVNKQAGSALARSAISCLSCRSKTALMSTGPMKLCNERDSLSLAHTSLPWQWQPCRRPISKLPNRKGNES